MHDDLKHFQGGSIHYSNDCRSHPLINFLIRASPTRSKDIFWNVASHHSAAATEKAKC